MLTKCFELVLLLNLTGLFSFVAVHVGIPIAAMSGGILVFLFVYLLVNYKYVFWLGRKKDILLWIFFLLIWPIVTLTYAEEIDFRAILVNLYLVTLMLATSTWLIKVGVHRGGWVVILAAVITVTGLVLSLVASEYFQSVADAANARSAYQGRAFGFFMQPNMAAENVIFLFALLLPITSTRRGSVVNYVTALFAAAILITGSRGAMLIAVALIVYSQSKIYNGRETVRTRSFLRKTGTVLVVAAALLGTRLLIGIVAGDSIETDHSLTSRIDAVASLDVTGGGMTETSVARYVALVEHWAGIANRPILGYGLSASGRFADSGQLTFAAHNQYLQVAFDLGLPALALFLYLIFRLWRMGLGDSVTHLATGFKPIILLVIGASLAGALSNTLLTSRVFFPVLGALFAMHYAPFRVFRKRLRCDASGRLLGESRSAWQ